MTRKLTKTEAYLRQLADELDALGPAETDEVLAEIRSHIAEAVSDTGGDEEAALARLGTAETLSTRILEERGVIIGSPAVPDAPALTRRLAVALDIAVSLFIFLLALPFLAPALFFAALTDGSAGFVAVSFLLLAVGAVLLFSAIWRWFRGRRPGRATIGMSVMGLRRIRVGATTRLVRSRDVPGLPQRTLGRLGWAARLALVLLLLSFLGCALYGVGASVVERNRQDVDAALQAGFFYSDSAVALVSGVYANAMFGATQEDLGQWFAPTASEASAQLLDRRAGGELASYQIWSVRPLDYSWPEPVLDEPGETYSFRTSVLVCEYPLDSHGGTTYDTWEYVVTSTQTCLFADSWSTEGECTSEITSVSMQQD
jgi:hypothetical protein